MSSPKSLLVQTLEDSANQFDQARVRDATQRLEEWRIQSGFFSTLQVRVLDATIFSKLRLTWIRKYFSTQTFLMKFDFRVLYTLKIIWIVIGEKPRDRKSRPDFKG
jgi:hypothetical protein